MFRDLGVPNAWEVTLDNEEYRLDTRPPGVEFYCLYGGNLKTLTGWEWFTLGSNKFDILRIWFHNRLKYDTIVTANGNPESIFGDGDGSINLQSLEGCLRWRDAQNQEFHYQKFSGVSHARMASDERILDYLKKILTANNAKKFIKFWAELKLYFFVRILIFIYSIGFELLYILL